MQVCRVERRAGFASVLGLGAAKASVARVKRMVVMAFMVMVVIGYMDGVGW